MRASQNCLKIKKNELKPFYTQLLNLPARAGCTVFEFSEVFMMELEGIEMVKRFDDETRTLQLFFLRHRSRALGVARAQVLPIYTPHA